MIIKAIGADGIFLDTMDRGSEEFRQKLDMSRKGVVLESELALPVEDISRHHMSWAQWFYDSPVPGILRNKWIEPRHMQHGISRWTEDKSKELQTAWMNGRGIRSGKMFLANGLAGLPVILIYLKQCMESSTTSQKCSHRISGNL